MDFLSGARGYQAFPLAGSPAGRLHAETTRRLASGAVPRCPHPAEPAFWYVPAGVLACAPCTDELMRASGGDADGCHCCGAPATAVAGWVVGGVPCLAQLCEACGGADGLVPIAPN